MACFTLTLVVLQYIPLKKIIESYIYIYIYTHEILSEILKEMYLHTNSTHFIYTYAKIW